MTLYEELRQTTRHDRAGFEFMVGIPGCGKSTYVATIKHPNIVVVSPDNIRREVTGNISDVSHDGYVWELVFDRVIENLKQNKYVILDATNVDTIRRRNFQTMIQNVFPLMDFYGKIFDCNPYVSIDRIRMDIENGIDRSNVPSYIVMGMYDKYLNSLDVIGEEDIHLLNEYGEIEFALGDYVSLPFGEFGQIINIKDVTMNFFPYTCEIFKSDVVESVGTKYDYKASQMELIPKKIYSELVK